MRWSDGRQRGALPRAVAHTLLMRPTHVHPCCSRLLQDFHKSFMAKYA